DSRVVADSRDISGLGVVALRKHARSDPEAKNVVRAGVDRQDTIRRQRWKFFVTTRSRRVVATHARGATVNSHSGRENKHSLAGAQTRFRGESIVPGTADAISLPRRFLRGGGIVRHPAGVERKFVPA